MQQCGNGITKFHVNKFGKPLTTMHETILGNIIKFSLIALFPVLVDTLTNLCLHCNKFPSSKILRLKKKKNKENTIPHLCEKVLQVIFC